MEESRRIIQEYVPGKQITLAHIIASPKPDIYEKLGLSSEYKSSIGILTITPSEGAIIAADVASKSADVEIGFIDRFNGTLIVVGTVASVQAAVESVLEMFYDDLYFSTTGITRS